MLIIRRFEEKDAEQASDLIIRALIEVNSKDYSEAVIRNLCELFSSQNLIEMSKKHDILVAIEDNQVVGTVRLKENAIYTVFVDPNYHHQGIGTELMQAIENLVKKRQFKEVKLGASITAIEFYKKLGYLDTRETYDDEYGLTYIMKKRL